MNLRMFLQDNASLQSRPRRRRHSIADVRFLHTLHDIPEKPEEEDTDKERRRSTGSFHQKERPRAASEPPCESTQNCNEGNVNVESTSEANGTTVRSSIDCNSPRYKRCFSFEKSTEESEHLIEAVSTYVLSYTDDAGNVCNTDDVSPTTTGSSSLQESSKETSDEELALSEMLRKVDTSMAPQRSRQGSVIEPDVIERITSLTPVVESSRSSSAASVSINLNGSPEDGDYNEGSELGSRHSSTKNTKEDVLGKILLSPLLTRRGSLSDVMRSLSPHFNKKSDLGRHDTAGNDGKLSSTFLSPHVHGHIKDPWGPLSPMNFNKGKSERDQNPNIQTRAKNESQSKKESENVLGKIMNSPNLLKRRGSLGDVLRTLFPQIGSSSSKVVDTKTSINIVPAAEKEHECNIPSKYKDGVLWRIIKSPVLTRRGSLGNILNTLSPNPTRRCPSPSPLTVKCDTDDAPSEKTSPTAPELPKSKDVQRSPGESRSKGLLAIVQQHVINHSQAMQRKRRNSIASTKPHTGTLELSLRESLGTGEWGNESNHENDSKSSVLKTTALIKDSLSNKNNDNGNSNNNSVNSNNNNAESKDIKRCGPADGMRNSNRPGAVLNHQVQGTAKASSPLDLSKSKEKSHTSAIGDVISPVPRKLVGSESMDVPRVQSPQRKISAPLPPRSIDPPQRKSSVNVIKRSPITFVIPNDKPGRTEGRVNAPDNQPSSGVGFHNSRFLPLSQEEADDYSRIKKTEASNSATINSTITMSSRVTVHGGGGKGVVRKLGISPKQPPLNDSLPTEERFAALSERYASLKAKLGGSDSKQKTQDSFSKPVEKSEHSPNTDDKLTQSKCWRTVESIPLQQFADHQVSDKRVASTESTMTAENGGKQGTDSEENGIDLKRITVTSSEDNHVSGNDVGVIETISSMNSIEKSPNIDTNNNIKPSIAKMQVENDEVVNSSYMAHAGKTTLDLRPESPAQWSRTTVLAKLMNRKMGPRRKQSIVPRVVRRRSKVYTDSDTGGNGIPASAAQFEKIRTVIESSVLRAPVRQEVR